MKKEQIIEYADTGRELEFYKGDKLSASLTYFQKKGIAGYRSAMPIRIRWTTRSKTSTSSGTHLIMERRSVRSSIVFRMRMLWSTEIDGEEKHEYYCLSRESKPL